MSKTNKQLDESFNIGFEQLFNGDKFNDDFMNGVKILFNNDILK